MNKPLFTGILAGLLLLMPASMTLANGAKKKPPLTLKQIGKNIGHGTTRLGKNIGKESTRIYKNGEYGVRKGGENVSVTTHRTIGNNSLVQNRGKKKTDLVKPDGTHYPKKHD